MGNRLSKIYTKTGDNGTTGLGVNERIAKDSLRIHAIGDTDELNSVIGFCIEALPEHSELATELRQVQHDLFDLGGELAMPGYSLVDDSIVTQLENQIDRHNAQLPPLKNFILPGGNEAASRCHMARSTCRRAERTLVTFNQQESQPHLLVQAYLNRLSDYLFVVSRKLAREDGASEVLWQSRHKREEE